MPRKRKQEESLTQKSRRTKRSTTPETPFDETPATSDTAGDAETEVRPEDAIETPAAVEQTVSETETVVAATMTQTATDDATGEAAAAAVEQVPNGSPSEIAQPEMETATALALKRWRERPTCCCGCGQQLSSSKKNFVQGHDGKAKVIVRKIMRGELPAGEAPTELILRHAEIKFIMRSPEFGRVVEMWREICGLTRNAAGK
jgi:hypothetical protein